MHGQTQIKFVCAKQAKHIYEYKNIKRRLHKTTAAIWYNKTCKEKQISPNYISIKINGNNRQSTNTLKAATQYRIKQEIKFLYIKKQKLNEQLYNKHLQCASLWPNYWPAIQSTIEENLQLEIEKLYNKLNKKLDKLLEKKKQPTNPNRKQKQQQDFFPRTVNLTEIKFTKEEQALLDLGLQHSIQMPIEKYWTNLILETEKAISLLETKEQHAFRIMATKKLKQIYNSNHNSYNTHKRQQHILRNIKHKLMNENAIVTQADKSKAIVIIYKQEYDKKIHTFLTNNNFHILPANPTNKDQIRIQKIAQQCNQIIQKQQVKYITQKNPTPPKLNAQLKLHKPETPIRPVVNNRTAPSHKIAKKLNHILNMHLHLGNSFNTQNSITLANDLAKLTINDRHKLLTLDIKDLYVNIPTKETINITRTQLMKHNSIDVTNQIINLLEVILGQNYFTYDDKIYQPHLGVAMGSPLSGTVAEIFIQNLENSHINQLLESQSITFYSRYVDDILIIYDSLHTNAKTILQYANTVHKNLQFNPTLENVGQINFLDLRINRKTPGLEIEIYRKPTTTSTTINYFSNHPLEQKLAAYRYYIERMLTLPLKKKHQNLEWNIILEIAQKNNFPEHILIRLKKRIKQRLAHQKPPTETKDNTKWTTFTYTSPQIRKITNLFKNTGIKIAFKCKNTIGHLIKPNTNHSTPYHNRSGIYKLICNTCKLAYVGQTSRSLKLRYQEHIRYIRNNTPHSAYAQHILNNQHEYGPMDNLMTLLKPLNNKTMLTPHENLFIQSLHQAGQLIPEQNPGEKNPLLQLAIDPSLAIPGKASKATAFMANT
jgi:hypothetical protein